MVKNDINILNRTCIPKDRAHRVAIICGDEKRFDMFKNEATNYREFGKYLCWKSAEFEFNGEDILLACHGVGSHPTAVLVRELIELGVKCIIRSGTSGTFQPRNRKVGDVCICYAAIRGDSSTFNDIDIAFPSVAHPDCVEALRNASEALNIHTYMDICYSSDLYYRNGIKGTEPMERYGKCSTAIAECENSVVLTLCNIHGIRGGIISTVDGCPFEWDIGNYGPRSPQMKTGKQMMVNIAMHAAVELTRKIREEEAQGITGI